MQIGDIVQYGCSEWVIIDFPNGRGDGDYSHVKVRCIECNDDFGDGLKVGDEEEHFAGRLAFLRKGDTNGLPA